MPPGIECFGRARLRRASTTMAADGETSALGEGERTREPRGHGETPGEGEAPAEPRVRRGIVFGGRAARASDLCRPALRAGPPARPQRRLANRVKARRSRALPRIRMPRLRWEGDPPAEPSFCELRSLEAMGRKRHNGERLRVAVTVRTIPWRRREWLQIWTVA